MKDQNRSHFKIALVGVEFEENLSLRYLAGALLAAGYTDVTVKPYNSLLDSEQIATALIQEEINLVGISMAFQVRAIEDMAFVQLLRKKEFKGHVTAGGQFATLHYQEIFEDCTGLDSIIRFEGESSIVAIADALSICELPDKVPGLVWKDQEGKVNLNPATPAPGDINALPLPFRKTHRPEFLGLKSIHMIGSRGCHATCSYCCVSALATERRTASRDSGASTAIAGTRRRTAINVANEMAQLYFKHEIRIFEFQDDNWIHPKISTAVEYFTELKNELDKRGVGQIGITLKTRADSVQPEVIKVLKEIGLIRVFVGIESGTQNLLSKLGRKSRDNVSLQALQILRDFEIPAYFNALLFGPDIHFEDIEPELEFLEKCTDFPFEIVEVVIYGKTGLYLSLKEEKRLHGNYLDYEYDYLDEITQKTHSLITKLETRHFGVYSPIKMAADLGFNLGVMQVFYPGEFTRQLAVKVKDLTQRINNDQVRIIRLAAQYSQEKTNEEQLRDLLIAETISMDLQFYREIIQLHEEAERYVKEIAGTSNIHSYYRVGAVIQSGLIAGLFMLLSGNVHSQPRYMDTLLKKQLVDLVYKPSVNAWKEAERNMITAKAPLWQYYREVENEVNSLKRPYKQGVNENMDQLRNKIEELSKKRIKKDYERLNAILIEHNPKIKIASTLRFRLDDKGKVVDVSSLSAKGNKELTPELKQIILDLLSEKQFYSYESFGPISENEEKDRKREAEKYYRDKRNRRGPLD